MPSLLDVATIPSTVPVQGTDLPVFGVSAKGIAILMERFPEVQKMLAGDSAGITPSAILAKAPEAVAFLIAAGCGHPGEADHEAAAAKLAAGDQMAILEKVFALTMPQGVGPFFEKLMALGNVVGVDSSKAPDTK